MLNADTQALLAAMIGGAAAQQIANEPGTVIAGDGAIDITTTGPTVTVLTKGSAAAITIAAPTTPGMVRTIISDSAFAHVITFTGNTLRGGTAAVATATFAAQKGASITVRSLLPSEAAWGVLSNVVATLA